MKILVIGSNGQLGWEVCRQGIERGFLIIPLDVPEFDITNRPAAENAVLKSEADLVVNCSAYTAVDKAEAEQEPAFSVNKDGPSHLAIACNKKGIPLIHISTDYVFDGCKEGRYCETDRVSPIGVYGKSKADGEEKVRLNLKEHIIIRTSWLYGVHGNNFVKTMLNLGREREEIRVVSDQHGCPTFAGDLAGDILDIASRINSGQKESWGTYHYCGGGSTTWFGFASKIFEIATGYETFKIKRVIPIKTSEYPTAATRPANSVMDCSLMFREFNIAAPSWEQSLDNMLGRYYSEIVNRS
ncbi:MAG: dTDP-4-dehydrorhamnose reductase [Deltaproteobacteria bacterium]|nr:dTDP-4-dehydrorhamnose reductase [Deltaproteobacteria bacterium]